MKSLANFFSIVAILGALASGVFYFLNVRESHNLAEELAVAHSQLSDANADIAKRIADLEDVNRQLEQSNHSLQEARSSITIISARSNQLKRENQRLSDELDMRLNSEESLQRSLADLKKEMAALRANTISLEEASDYEQKIASLESEILKLKNAPNIVPTNSLLSVYENLKAAPKDLDGRILTVGPQSSFVITNLGYASGVRLDHLLEIQRNGELVANIQVTEVKENLSIARILPESMKTDPESGDVVVSGDL